MNKETVILDRPSVKIFLDKHLELFTVRILPNSYYNQEGFDEFLNYFRNTWKVVNSNNEIYKLYIDIESSKENDLPLPAYMNLLKCITDINDLLKTNCHCICIYTLDAKKWQDVYNFITKLWNPKENRPIIFTDNESDKKLFLQSNRLITNDRAE
tara:strand:+ start:1266 stop:1730 length:465 start_codon:yes stop_codon:yes gene_type:complete